MDLGAISDLEFIVVHFEGHCVHRLVIRYTI